MGGSKAGDRRPEEGEGLVSRWARLKQESRRALPSAAESAAESEAPAPETDERKDSEPVRVEDLPDVDSLTYESDFTVFLRAGVPEELKRLALRKLWRSDPVLANLDGLNDYDLDYRSLGVDTRVTEALLAQRGMKDRLLRGDEEPPARSREDEPSAPSSEAATTETAEAVAEEADVTEAAAEKPDSA